MVQGAGRVEPALEEAAEAVLDRLGFELVDFERAGHRARPILRLRIDRSGAGPGRSVTVDDCALVSRELESVLDVREDLPSSYILEVSSPGVERPLRKRRDFERCVGREVALRGYEALAQGSRRLQGVLLGVKVAGGSELIRIRQADGAEVDIPISRIARAHMVFNWEEFDFGKSRRR